MNPKPIAVVYVPAHRLPVPGRHVTWQELHDWQQALEQRSPDYYWFVLPDWSQDPHKNIELKVFHEKDFSETQYEDLRKLIKGAIKRSFIESHSVSQK